MKDGRRGRKDRPLRRRTAETVTRTHLAVITAPTDPEQALSVKHAVDLVKASMLYADTVEVLSLGNQMIRNLNVLAAGESTNLLAVLDSLDDKTLRHLSPGVDVQQLRQMIPILGGVDPEAVRSLAAADPEMQQLADFADVLDVGQATMNSAMADLRVIAERMRVDSGVAELESAVAHRLLRFNDAVPLDGDSDTVIGAFVEQLKRYLQDPLKFVLLDATIASLAKSLIDEGLVRVPQRALSNASEAALGTGIFLAELPALTGAPMDELVDLRRDLDEPLGRYRRKVSYLRDQLQTGPFDEHINAEIQAIWRTEVTPALNDIRQAMAEHGLASELLRALGADLSNFVKGGMLPAAAITIFSANVLDLGTAVTAGLAAGSAVAPTAARALIARQQGRTDARMHDLYYIYEVRRRVQP